MECRVSQSLSLRSGAIPSIASFNASVVKIYNTTSSLVLFKINKKFSSVLALHIVVNSKVVGLAQFFVLHGKETIHILPLSFFSRREC
jgi:hypothetical protein